MGALGACCSQPVIVDNDGRHLLCSVCFVLGRTNFLQALKFDCNTCSQRPERAKLVTRHTSNVTATAEHGQAHT